MPNINLYDLNIFKGLRVMSKLIQFSSVVILSSFFANNSQAALNMLSIHSRANCVNNEVLAGMGSIIGFSYGKLALF